MAFLKPSRLRKPQAARLMRWTLELMDSLAALVIFSAMALTMPQRWSRIKRASTIQVRHATVTPSPAARARSCQARTCCPRPLAWCRSPSDERRSDRRRAPHAMAAAAAFVRPDFGFSNTLKFTVGE